MELKDKDITVMGMGRTGIAAANFLVRRGARVTLTDRKEEAELREAVSRLDSGVNLRFATDAPADDAEIVVLSPGIDIDSPELEPARRRGAEIISEIELAFRFNTAPVIAVTGTNGKSTTTTLVGEILKEAGKNVRVGGNLGVPFIALLEGGPVDFMVLEISSFQLEAVRSFNPKIGAVLNVTPDHLDRHGTLGRYTELKGRITARQTEEDLLVLNRDDPRACRIGQSSAARKAFFSLREDVEEGAFLRGDQLILRRNGAEAVLVQVRDLRRVMQWQAENVLAAAVIAAEAGVAADAIGRGAKNFSGLRHRLEWVGQVEGVDFINDSKSTNVGAVRKSLQSFDRPVILIAGGQDKGSDFTVLKELFRRKVKHLVLIGESKPKFYGLLNGSFSHEDADSLEQAVQQARKKARPGDIVLLSPACASFDMFRNFEDRGDRFKEIVGRL